MNFRDDYFLITLEDRRNPAEMITWCEDRFGRTNVWYYYVFCDNNTVLFGFENQNDIFEFKMRWA